MTSSPTATGGPRLGTGFRVDVPTTKRVQAAVNLEAGTLIYNTDTVNGVWLSSNPAVAVGNGIRLGALGSMKWLGGPCYAIVDTGVASAVSLQISGDVSDIVNPVDVATTTAAQLAAQGVPNVLKLDLIGLYSLLGANSGNSSGYQYIDCSKYAALLVYINFATNSILQGVTVQTTNQAGGVGTSYLTFECLGQPIGGDNAYQWIIPVIGPYMKFTNCCTTAGASGTAQLRIYGSNRPVDRLRLVTRQTVPGRWALNKTWAAVGAVDFLPASGTNNNNLAYNGTFSYRGSCSGTGTGLIGLRYTQADDAYNLASQDTYLGQIVASSQGTFGQWTAPGIPGLPIFYPLATGAFTAALEATPGGM